MEPSAAQLGRLGTIMGLVCWCLAAVIVGSARAELLPIVNPGFEALNAMLRPGEQTNGLGGGISPVTTRWAFPFQPNGNMPQSGVLVPGWRSLIPPQGGNSPVGVLRPDVDLGNGPWMSGYSGSYVAAAQAGHTQQTLNVQLRPSTTYTLSFLAGIGLTDSEYAPLIGLFASPDLETLAFPSTPGVTTLARMPLTSIQPAQFGTMLPFSFSYTTPEVLPANLLGHYIVISWLGSDGFPRMCYDDFRLVASPAPGTGVVGVMVGVFGARRRRGAPAIRT